MTSYRFDPKTHRYYIADRSVPSVTQVLADLLPIWLASDWYLVRGRAVHAACAMIARGVKFNHDPRIDGQIEACRRFFKQTGWKAESIEQPVYSHAYQYAGTYDLIAVGPNGNRWFVDYKSTLTKTVPIQLAAYWLASDHGPSHGVGVELHEDGTYKMSETYNLKRFSLQWTGLLTAYKVRRELEIRKDE